MIFRAAENGFRLIPHQQVTEIEMHVGRLSLGGIFGNGMDVDVQRDSRLEMPWMGKGGDARFFLDFPDGGIERRLGGFDMAAGLEPSLQVGMEHEQHGVAREDDAAGGHVARPCPAPGDVPSLVQLLRQRYQRTGFRRIFPEIFIDDTPQIRRHAMALIVFQPLVHWQISSRI
ncbi:hypothetical protein Aave_1356 [Paracidovorax citrulli AAC00-1]|uniref:Uncharacterized protein n=1 Tax=Paracidovorax citrulli (strain AAC00-1) TaxID=397945 RepID=A1TLV9_PARC0|nr:hypothetical protein Aave_1356 [Paracidovorax citrulli AAC00-1]